MRKLRKKEHVSMPTNTHRRSPRSWLMPVTVAAVAIAMLTVVVVLNQDPGDTATDTAADSPTQQAPNEAGQPDEPDLTVVERRDETDLLAAGPVDAPVGLVVFSDYQCPFCAQWSEETLPLLMEHVEAGDLRVEWRDVNVFGEASERAARASYAAAQQDAFWEYHDALFAEGDVRSEQDLTDESLIDLAAYLNLDTDQFAQDLDDDETAEEIARNAQLGLELGAHSTPTFLLGGEPIVGAQPSQVFLDAFDTALADAE